jgi:WD40 repeat protein
MCSLRVVLIVIAGFVLFGGVDRGELVGAQKAASHTDCYGDELPPGALLRLGTTRFRENQRCYGVAYSPDGKLLASAGYGGIVLWEAESGKRRDFLESRLTHMAVENGLVVRMDVCSLAFSSDGRYLAAGCSEESIVWELATGKTFYLPSEKDRITATDLVGFSPDNRAVITGDAHVVQVREIKTGKVLKRWELPFLGQWRFRPKVLSADGKTVVAVVADASGKTSLQVWDIAGKMGRKIDAAPGSLDLSLNRTALALSPDKTLLAVANNDGNYKLTLVDAIAGKVIRSWSVASRPETGLPNSPPFPGVAFSPDGKSLATKGFLWTVATGKERHRLEGDEEGTYELTTYGLCFSPDGKRLAAGKGSRIELWDANTGKKAHDFPNHKGHVMDLAYSPDGRQLATAGWDSTIRLWDTRTGRFIRSFGSHRRSIQSLAFLPDGRRLAANGESSVVIWNIAEGSVIREIGGPNSSIRSIAVSPDGKTLLAAGSEELTAKNECRYIREWNVDSGEERRHYGECAANIFSIAISPDGKRVAAASDDDIVRLWDRETGKLVRAEIEPPRPDRRSWRYALDFSPDGGLLAAVCSKGSAIDLVDVPLGRYCGEIIPYRRPRNSRYQSATICSSVFSPDGKTILCSGGGEEAILLLEVFSGQVRLRFKSCTEKVVFAPDGKTAACKTLEGGALIWDLSGRRAGEVWRDQLSDKELERLWAELASTDAAVAHRAIWRLLAGKNKGLPFLRRHIRAVPFLTAEKLKELIDGLDSDSFEERERASRALAEQRERAKPALLATVAQSRSLEQRRRAADLLAALPKSAHFLPASQLRLVRAIEVLEHVGGQEAQKVLEVLAEDAAGRVVTGQARAALQRLRRRSR